MMQGKEKSFYYGVAFILSSAVCTSVGQLFWKLATSGGYGYLAAGLCLYGIGAVLMTVSFRFGALSALHPMLSVGYVLSLVFGSLILGEAVTFSKVGGIILIMAGLILLAGNRKKAN